MPINLQWRCHNKANVIILLVFQQKSIIIIASSFLYAWATKSQPTYQAALAHLRSNTYILFLANQFFASRITILALCNINKIFMTKCDFLLCKKWYGFLSYTSIILICHVILCVCLQEHPTCSYVRHPERINSVPIQMVADPERISPGQSFWFKSRIFPDRNSKWKPSWPCCWLLASQLHKEVTFLK